jgi:Transposase DDE domain group 1
VVLDMDSTEIPVYGQQEQSAYNGHFESTCYHPLLLFNREGDCLAAKFRQADHRRGAWTCRSTPEARRACGEVTDYLSTSFLNGSFTTTLTPLIVPVTTSRT